MGDWKVRTVQDIEQMSRKKFSGIMKYYNGAKGWMELKKHFKAELAPPGLTFEKFLNTIQGMTNKKLGRDGMDGTFTYRTLLVADRAGDRPRGHLRDRGRRRAGDHQQDGQCDQHEHLQRLSSVHDVPPWGSEGT